jgi:hypothetical protein
MINPISAYTEAGEKAGEARRVHDEACAKFHSDWANRAMALETGEYKQQARQAFDSAYTAARNVKML